MRSQSETPLARRSQPQNPSPYQFARDNFDDHIFDPIRSRAGLPDIRFHNLRHFFASMLIAQGESAQVRQ